MPPYTIQNTPTRSKLSQAVVPAISTHQGIAGSGFYHFPPAHNRPNGPVSFKRTRIIRDLQQGAYCICVWLRYSTQLNLNLIEWEHPYVKLNNALSAAFFSGTSRKTNEARIAQKNRLFSSSRPTAQISIPVSANMTPSEIWRLVDVNQIKHIHFGRMAIFSSTRLLIALVEFRPFTTMSEAEVNQQDEFSQFLFCERRFTNPIATNGALLEGFMFIIGWRKCSTKNEQFGLYGSLGKIENAKDEWWN
ncbi:hypothetical protein O181_034430 [Austropuccinia psidii MF-1]|uniref:Tet-like 2OG-Fe(II) oxygenase domain-containing protein n=1 Tax=Austropuccinia psidii MF-1 TaxID=1389203 RepID=A0A9Q3D308_9BASI|nr:hypothetical protein [Austropuccinia psidii MF-1]